MQAVSGTGHVTGRGHRAVVLVATSLAAFTATLDNTVVAVALRDIQADLGAGVAELQGVVTAYTVALAALLLAGGLALSACASDEDGGDGGTTGGGGGGGGDDAAPAEAIEGEPSVTG